MEAFYLSLHTIKLISVLHVLKDYRTILHSDFLPMPTEKAEKKIDRLKTKLESLNSVSDAISLGGSAIAAMQNQIIRILMVQEKRYIHQI